jgi:hypothetical protein
MDRRYALFAGLSGMSAAVVALLAPATLTAQLNVSAVNTAFTINFDGSVSGVSNGVFAGGGFQPTPAVGRLDSDAWASTGWSDGNLAFGGTRITSGTDYRRGTTAPGNGVVAVGGIWSMGGAGITGRALGFQQNAVDANPGTVTLRVRNTTGSVLTTFDVAYKALYRNDQDQSSTVNLSWSSDNITYTSVPAVNVTTPGPLTGTSWVSTPRSTSIGGVVVPNNGFFYIRWTLGTAPGGSGAWDELALDDISVTGRAWTLVRLTSAVGSVSESAGTGAVVASIINPDPVNPTSVSLALTSGSAARVNNYTTQTITFPGGSLLDQTQVITITDNGDCDGDASIGFALQNISGGTGTPSIGKPDAYVLNIDDDETGPAPTTGQAFDGGTGDNVPIISGSGNVNTNIGAADFPANQRIYNGSASWQVNNAFASLTLDAADVTDWSNIVLSARLSSTSTISAGGADLNDSVAFYIDLNGAGFPLVPDVRISGSSNSQWGYASGTGIAIGTAGIPVTYVSSPSGTIYAEVRITIPNGTSSVALRVEARNNDNTEIWNIDDIQFTGILCSQVYYSRANGSEATATWSTARTGAPAPGAVTFTRNKSMVIQAGHTVTTTGANFNTRSLTVETGGSLDLGGTTTVGVYGPDLKVDGTFNGANDHIQLRSDALTVISGTAGTMQVKDMTLNGFGARVDLNILRLTGTLQLTKGDFNANGKEVQLLSTATGTARLGPVAAAASYTDRLRIERYIPAGVTDWRLLCSPMQNKTIQDWTDDFFTAGFPGSAYPNFFQNNQLWPSIRSYDETNTGSSSSDGLVGPASVTDPLTIGKGFAAWSGDNYFTTNAFVVDVRGFPTVASTPFTLPMTYTNTGNATVDGLNLVGNPVPSPIDFSLVSRGSDVDPFYYIYDPGSGSNAVWDEANSLGTLGANGNIQSCQGFWLHASGPNITTTVSETAKVLEPLNGGIFSQQEDDRPLVRLRLANASNERADEAIVHFINGAPDHGAFDVAKLPFVHPEAVTIATLTTEGLDMAINAYGDLTGAVDIPVTVDVQVDGNFTITASSLSELGGRACLSLEDLSTGTVTQLTEGASYTFSMAASDPVLPARFVLHVGTPVTRSVTDVTCAGADDGSITVAGSGTGPWDYVLADAFSNPLVQVSGATGTHVFTGLAGGNYVVTVDGGTGCGALNGALTVGAPSALDVEVEAQAAGCALVQDGSIAATVLGGTAPYTLQWSSGATGDVATDLAAGTYSVTVTDARGCEDALTGIVVAEGVGPVAEFEAVPSAVLVNEPVDFFNNSTYGAYCTWDLGDGTQSNDNEPVHAYAQPGIYTVTLTVEEGDCSAVTSQDVAVSVSTSVAEQAAPGIMAWSEGALFIVQWQVSGAASMQADVIDATGKLVLSRSARGAMGRMTVDGQELPAGIYFVRVTTGDQQRTFRLPMVR